MLFHIFTNANINTSTVGHKGVGAYFRTHWFFPECVKEASRQPFFRITHREGRRTCSDVTASSRRSKQQSRNCAFITARKSHLLPDFASSCLARISCTAYVNNSSTHRSDFRVYLLMKEDILSLYTNTFSFILLYTSVFSNQLSYIYGLVFNNILNVC